MHRLSRSGVLDGALGVAAALGLVVITQRIGATGSDQRVLDGVGYGCVVVAGLSLSLRRRAPTVGVLAAGGAVALYAVRDYPGGPVFLAPLVAAFFLASAHSLRRTLPAVAAATAALLVTALADGTGDSAGWLPVVFVGWMTAAVLLGEAARARRDRFAALEERARYLEQSREQEARRRVAEERLRVARDVHDVVAHTLSGIALQAGVGAKLAEADAARESFATIRRSAKEGLGELRTALDLLRGGGGSPPRQPTPALADLGRLLDDIGAGGIELRLVTRGTPRPLPSMVEVAAYRIAQESLTNAARHSGSPRAVVRLTYGGGWLEVEVLDEGCGSVYRANDGHGIAGMRERALAAGGRFEAGPRPEGGFRVWAELPTGDGVAP
jgi:signal transduction histidine kinase